MRAIFRGLKALLPNYAIELRRGGRLAHQFERPWTTRSDNEFFEGGGCSSNEQNTIERKKRMSNLKDKAKDKLADAANAVKKTSEKVADKTKDLAHQAGKAVEKRGKRLQEI